MRACVWTFVWLCVFSCIYCCTSCVISLYVCDSESMCMKVCMIVCLVPYILLYVLCYFIICVWQWEHVYESLYDCVSSPVYIVVRLVLFHYRCVSVRACVWAFVWLCVVLYVLGVCQGVYIVVRLMLFNYRCVSGRTFVWKFVWLCVLSCIYCCTSCVISLYVCGSESMCIKVCMIVCYPVYIVVRLMLFHYGCVSVIDACVLKFVWLCVLSCIYCRTSYVISLYVCVCQLEHVYVISLKFVWLCVVLYILSYVLCYSIIGVCQCLLLNIVRLVYACVWKFVWLCVLSCIYCRTSCVISLYVCVS